MAQMNYIGISEERIMHMLQVGRTAYQLSKEMFNWDETKCQQMFTLGLMHDCGYEYSESQSDHPVVGATLLSECNYQFSEEIRWHGIASAPYESDELLVLNIADLLTGSLGEIVSLNERLCSIKNKYGRQASQYREACLLALQITHKLQSMPATSNTLISKWKKGNHI